MGISEIMIVCISESDSDTESDSEKIDSYNMLYW